MTAFYAETQRAIVTALRADQALSVLCPTITNFQQQHATLPVIVIGDDRMFDDSTKTELGARVDIEIHVWSAGASMKEAKQIMDRIYELLHHETVGVDGSCNYFIELTQQFVKQESDAVTWHGVQRFRILLSEWG